MAGASPGKECIFPFKFRGVTHNACAQPFTSGYEPWCSTKVDDDGVHMGAQDWGDCNENCPKEFTTNLTQVQPRDLDLAKHLLAMHKSGKQHGIIFVGSGGHASLLLLLASITPSIFSSNCPLLIPIEYRDELKLRLDSNIIFYKAEPGQKYKLIDSFAIKGGPTISVPIGYWDMMNGISFVESKNRWDRRSDLRGATFLNGFYHNYNLAEFVRDAEGKVVGSEGYFQDLLFYMTDRLNVTIKTVEYGRQSKYLENDTWTGPKGAILRKEVDVHSAGTGITLGESLRVYDYPIPIILLTDDFENFK